LPWAKAEGKATPAAAAAKALRMKLRRPLLASARTVLIPSRFKKLSGALWTLPDITSSCILKHSFNAFVLYFYKAPLAGVNFLASRTALGL
jgi:hypothetical protein